MDSNPSAPWLYAYQFRFLVLLKELFFKISPRCLALAIQFHLLSFFCSFSFFFFFSSFSFFPSFSSLILFSFSGAPHYFLHTHFLPVLSFFALFSVASNTIFTLLTNLSSSPNLIRHGISGPPWGKSSESWSEWTI